ncbi:hypothetical protein LTR64_004475 [Lithohypha guttulata]|uniref:uncharacterized protein n=1 Tax=Lithohypha guttulata TaxID=1690604 RepID=UPI002DDE367C|nr:hypothetical protein LTR51_006229 [Lithohypha guttulata]
MQLDAGFHAISDGEYRRQVFWGQFFEDLEGMSEIRNPSLDIFREYVPDMAGFVEKGDRPGQSYLCKGKLKHRGKSALADAYNYMKTVVPEKLWPEIKVTLITPSWYHLRYKDGLAFPKDVYKTDEEYFEDVATAYQQELDLLYEAGVRNVQFDDPLFAYFCSEKMVAGWAADSSNKRSLDDLLNVYIDAYNKSISKHTSKMHFGLHICRGNFMGSRHFSEGGYDRIATKIFKDLNVQTYYLEYDTPRAGSFEPLLHLPNNKNVILGVITSKFPELEDQEKMKARVFEAADVVAKGAGQSREDALKRLGVSPQCGFASHEEGNAIVWQDMENKLKLVRALADSIWPGEP